MAQWRVWLLPALLFTVIVCCSAQEDLNVVTNDISEGVTTQSVTLKCTYHIPGYYKDNFIITWFFEPSDGGEKMVIMSKTDDENPIYYGRASGRMEHVGTRADLKINRLELLDDGIYTCDVNFYLAKASGDGKTNLLVHHFVDFVDILQYNEGDYVWAPAGQEISFDCKATRAKPAAVLSWYKNNAIVEAEPDKITENSDGTFNTESTMTMEATLKDHNARIKCESRQEPRLLQGQRKHDIVVLNTSGTVVTAGSVIVMTLSILLSHILQ
ncbi:cell adhesion molecule 3-like [Ptychodera flava]|uniref:cell adhesion molecule 3-like n=1 Tax=Ptychodera flava TaxID=63121 RepID=UPI00396A5DA4